MYNYFYKKFYETDENKRIRKEIELYNQNLLIHKKLFQYTLQEIKSYRKTINNIENLVNQLNKIIINNKYKLEKLIYYKFDCYDDDDYSYDTIINNKYKVNVNNQTVERIKNFFR